MNTIPFVMMIIICEIQKISCDNKMNVWLGEKTLNVTAIKMKIYDNCQLLVHMTHKW